MNVIHHVRTFSGAKNRPLFLLFLLGAILAPAAKPASAHPLGNFTVNHFSRLRIGKGKIPVRYIVDMAEIPAFQALQAIDADHDGKPSDEELRAYAEQQASSYGRGLWLTIDGARAPWQSAPAKVTTPEGAGGLPTLRLECEFFAPLQADAATHRLTYEDANDPERTGWHEIVVAPDTDMAVFDSTAFANGLTDELRAYPEDRLA